jgi:hypothetical protein
LVKCFALLVECPGGSRHASASAHVKDAGENVKFTPHPSTSSVGGLPLCLLKTAIVVTFYHHNVVEKECPIDSGRDIAGSSEEMLGESPRVAGLDPCQCRYGKSTSPNTASK